MKIVPNAVSRNLVRQVLTLKKHSPHIAFGVGVVGVVAGTVMACRATLHLEEVVDDARADIDDVKLHRDEDDPQRGKDLAYIYGRAGGRLIRLYGPSVAVTGVSIVLLTGSHVTMTKRNNALTATVVALSKAYDEYRDRVREEVGEERELELYHGIYEVDQEDEKGKLIKVKTLDVNKLSPYARMFDEYSPHWNKDPELNRLYVQVQQNYANELLRARGHVFLNEVYDMLGLDRTPAGAVVGWVISEDGDNYVDFGVFNASNSSFINGWERSVLMDFNVDGVIYDKIG